MGSRLFVIVVITILYSCKSRTDNDWHNAKQIYKYKGLFFLVMYDEIQNDYRVLLYSADSTLASESNYMKSSLVTPLIDTIEGKYIILSFCGLQNSELSEKEIIYMDTLHNKKDSYPDYFIHIDTFEFVYKLPKMK